ncbi:MAG: hypothetical protein WCA49_23250 [Candidatus Sulfotelmatobacter sp.]
MNRRSQLSPIFSPPGSNSRLPPAAPSRGSRARWQDAKLFRSWLVYDSDLEATRTQGRFNWNVVSGLVLMAVVSGGGWFCIGLLARHFLK